MAIDTTPYGPGELIELRFALRELYPDVRARDACRVFGKVIRRRSPTSKIMQSFITRGDFERVLEELAKSRVG